MPAIKDNPDIDSSSVKPDVPTSGPGSELSLDDIVPKGDVPKSDAQPSENKDASQPAQDGEKKPEAKETQKEDDPKKKREYDPYRVRDFLIRLAKAAKRHEARRHAHNQFHDHVDKIKKSIVSKRKKSETTVDNDIDELKKKVSYLVSIEKGQGPSGHDKLMQEKILLLEGKLDKLLQSKLRREDRFQQLEKKISSKYTADKELVAELEKKLLLLERKLIEHQLNKRKSKKKQDIAKIKDIKEQINTTKELIGKHK